MAGNGPAPNPNAKRTNVRVGMTLLPVKGRRGRTPKWPLPDNPRLTAAVRIEQDLIEELEDKQLEEEGLSRAEATKLTRSKMRLVHAEEKLAVVAKTEVELWQELWHTPQAVAWEQLGWTREVAQYVRWKVLAEVGDLDAGKEARQYADRLGLNPKAMRALMWVIDDSNDLADKRQQKTPTKPPAKPQRKLRAVDNGA